MAPPYSIRSLEVRLTHLICYRVLSTPVCCSGNTRPSGDRVLLMFCVLLLFCGQHVVEFLAYLDQFGKTKVHQEGCHYYGQGGFQACACPMKQAWGSLDSLIGRLRSAYDENGGRPEVNPFAERVVRQYLKDVRDKQLRARGAEANKKRKRRSKAGALGGRGAGAGHQEPAPSEGHSGSGGQSKDEVDEPLQRHSSAEQGRTQLSMELEGLPSVLAAPGRRSVQEAPPRVASPGAPVPGAAHLSSLGGSGRGALGQSGGEPLPADAGALGDYNGGQIELNQRLLKYFLGENN